MTTSSTYHADVHPDLLQEQLALEMGMRDAGVLRFRKSIERMIKNKTQDETSYGQRLVSHQILPVAEALEHWVEAGRGRAGSLRIAQPYLEAIGDYRVVAMLGLKAVTSQLMQDRPRLTRVAVSIGKMLEDELRCRHLRSADKKAYNGLVKATKDKGQYKRKADTAKFILSKKENIGWDNWPDKHCLHIGMAVIDCIQDTVGLIEFYELRENGKTITCIRPTEDAREWVVKNVEFMKFLAPVLEPMIIPPQRWVSGELRGGYISDHIPRRTLVKTLNRKYLEELKYADMPIVLSALNAAQETAYRINTEVLDLLYEVAARNSEMGDVPRAELFEIPPKPADVDYNEQSRYEYRKRAKAVHEANVQLTSRRISFMGVLATAKKYSKYGAIYFPYQTDFRSRIYPIPHLNPQGPDYMKALLQFSEGKRIGEEGIAWMKVHIANLFGVDKVSFDDRIAWVDENTEELLACAAEPMDNKLWLDADKPFMAWVACRELAGIMRHGADHISHMPVNLDGSCSGIQHLSMAFKDEIGGKAVNLVPSDVPSDIYRMVAEETVRSLEETCQNSPVAENGTPLEQWWLDFGIDRKVCKRNCMTYPYGSKQRGFSDQILEDTLDPALKKGDATLPENVVSAKLASVLANVNYASVRKVVVKASEAMDWMQEAARMVAKEGRPVTWKTPIGFPVVQDYRATREIRVETTLAGDRKTLSIREDTLKPDTRKAANSISPNVVHSLDATHLMMVVAKAHEEGMRSFSLIHDSFGVHACDMPRFYGIIRETMVELYDGGVFESLSDQFKAQIHPDKHDDFPPLPENGTLDPELILDSQYCFA